MEVELTNSNNSEVENGVNNAERDGDSDDDDNVKLPRVHKKGLPLWIFRLIRCGLHFCPFDAFVMFPLLLVMVMAALGVAINFFEWQGINVAIYGAVGLFAAACMAVWLHWVGQHPHVPDATDVAVFSVADKENWPQAPLPPVRGELVANQGAWFRDDQGRRVLLRGINFQAGSKLPAVPADQRGTHMANAEFTNYQTTPVSFVGRPFAVEEIDFHLGRLRVMGLTVLRFLITWEAVEHEGPGIYDEEYLEYLKTVVQKCSSHGISVFIDFHQDVWSRWTGGDGAPAWTLEKVGFNLDTLDDSAAALTQQNCTSDEYPKMVWNSNNARLAAGTMWTLFFAGNDFAPKTFIDGLPVQEFLQSHLLAAMSKVAETLRNERNVLGFDILNEPSVGFVGVKDVRDIGPVSHCVARETSVVVSQM